MKHLFRLLLLVTLARLSWLDAQAAGPDFVEQVRPIFANHCFECHGPDLQESNYRLDIRTRALGSGDRGQPIVAGASKSSPLIRYVLREDDETAMPPDGAGNALSAEQVQILRDWIDAGAEWPDEVAGDENARLTTDHWSFQPITNPTPPASSSAWPQNVIDQFVLKRLDAHALPPADGANRVTLIRRLYLDMHGLPPTGQEVSDFLKDPSADAWRRLVDVVLKSPRYGERWARHWLDVARFGESTGFEVNRDRENAYYYRDYVIESLNHDKSYRDFVIEQLAGDVMGADVGTGFLVGGPYDLVKSPDINLTLAQRQDELADYVNTTATAFLAMTVGCARCHNHKFDPILQKDYYAMAAVFAGVEHGERELPGAEEQKQQIAALKLQAKSLDMQIDELRASAPPPASVGERDSVNFRLNVEAFEPTLAKTIRFTINDSSSGEPCIDELEVFDVDGRNVALAEAGAVATASGTLPGYKIHQLAHINDGKFGNEHSWISNTVGGGWVQITFANATRISKVHWGRDRSGSIRDRLATHYTVEVATQADEWTKVASAEDRKPFGKRESKLAFMARLPEAERQQAQELVDRSRELREQISKLTAGIPMAYIGRFKSAEPIHRLYRGEPTSPRELVLPDALSVVGSLGLDSDTPENERRLALAQWIASRENPLTARVIVNRVWHHHFGTGIVSTPSDFGKNGSPPSHPELLDWLAWNFMQNDWSLKWLHREILNSATYQQSSAPREDALAIDADSRLLWRFPPRRLEAEAIRDCVLEVTGSLEHRGGGPGFLLLEIDHENVHHYFPKKEIGPPEFRRMIYMTKIRQEQDAVFGVFDCPDGGQVIPSRSRSTTPLQALNLLNSDFMLQQARQLADRVDALYKDDRPSQIRELFRITYSRDPNSRELRSAEQLADEYGLPAVSRAILNSNEFLFLQ